VPLDMAATALLQANGRGGLRAIQDLNVRAGLVQGCAAIVNDDFPSPDASTSAAEHKSDCCTPNMWLHEHDLRVLTRVRGQVRGSRAGKQQCRDRVFCRVAYMQVALFMSRSFRQFLHRN
jgi:hypothetical protein